MGVVGIMSTMHGEDSVREEFGYTLGVMEQAIAQFKPHIICGEVRPEDWEKYCSDSSYSGYLGPNEYRRMIIPYCEKEGVEFVPVDWFEFDLISLDYLNSYDDIEKEKIMKQHDEIYEKIFEAGKRSPFLMNSFEFNELVREKQQWMGSFDPVVHNMIWTVRNQIMVERIKRVIEKHKCDDKRILCTCGSEHVYFYYDELKKTGCQLVFPIK